MLAYIESSERLLQSIVGMLLTILLLSSLLNRFRQPYFIAYILAGMFLGPHGIKVFTDIDTIASIGTLGLIMQMFFIGAEIEVPSLIKNAKTLVIAIAVQLLLSLGVMKLVAGQLGWGFEKAVLFGFIISMSSSAIILDYLIKNNEINTRLGTITTGILIMQDFLLVPMIMVLNIFGKEESNPVYFVSGLLVMILFMLMLRKVVLRKRIQIPLIEQYKPDHEMQVFIGLLLCFGFAWITSILHLSAAMGAMFAGMIISQTQSTRWLDRTLLSFRVFFLAIFFISIGLQINLTFIKEHLSLILTLTLTILLINSVINAFVFRILKETWKNSLYAGALLSQIGEFSLVLCTVAKALKLVDDFSFQLTLAVISMTMLLTSAWISIIRVFLFRNERITTS